MAAALGEDLAVAPDIQDDSSSLGSDSELNGPGPFRRADRYGFIGGSANTSEAGPGQPPLELIRQREMKWVEMTSHWEKTMSRRAKKVKIQCRKGIPSALRARCWPLLCGAQARQQQNPSTYQELLSAPGDPQWLEAIRRDLHRQFPLHEMFLSPQGHGQQGLLNVLKAYTLYRPEQGYCQAQGPVAAVLLMQMPPEAHLLPPQEAFWCLVQICEFYLPGYYGPHMEAIRLDAEVFSALLGRLCPRIHKHLHQQGVGPLLYLPEWFLCLFARSLPFATVLRIWDAFFSEGVKVLFRVGLTLVRLALGTAEQRRACPGLLETLEMLRSIPPAQLQEDLFMAQVHAVAISERDLRRESLTQLAKLQKTDPELQLRPKDRLPGAPAIFEAQQLTAASKAPGQEVPRIVVQPPEEHPRRKPQTRGKTFHGMLTRHRGLQTEGPSRTHRASSSFLDTRF
ncbi:carabin isoform X1 [Gracilinanus agilis]|uniref:carabin isoform X1 n=1 Tax=Gracilinanus agilis TaxID=191870 RepID=UPI001CFE7645|nr:carabin isoform X1 [Gracilinanus agilis]